MVNIGYIILSKFLPFLSKVLYVPLTKKYMQILGNFASLIKVNYQGLIGAIF